MTQRLSNAKEMANKPALQSHEDLARKLQVIDVFLFISNYFTSINVASFFCFRRGGGLGIDRNKE